MNKHLKNMIASVLIGQSDKSRLVKIIVHLMANTGLSTLDQAAIGIAMKAAICKTTRNQLRGVY